MSNDVLSWEHFFSNSKKRSSYPPKEMDLFNRLVAHSKNFFAISAIGPFTEGYLLIVTKKLLPSFALIEDDKIEEMNWFIKSISKAIEETYDRNIVIFEHGMCACVGGLDRAHLHLMTVDKKINNQTFINSINKVLYKRKAGIEYVQYNGYKLENIHDITQIMNSNEKNTYKVVGKQFTYDDIKNDLDYKKWPKSVLEHVNKGGHYVYFNNHLQSSSFLTDKNFNTQLGREILFEVEIDSNNKLKKFYDNIIKQNPYANVWKWQEFPFNENISKTMLDIAPSLLNIKNLPDAKLHEFETFSVKLPSGPSSKNAY